MNAEPQFAAALEAAHPGITGFVRLGVRGVFSDRTPASVGLTWHHHPERPGVMQLVPRSQHRAPGPVQESLHPNQKGEWNCGAGSLAGGDRDE